jgi:hypothetical protein
MWVVGRETSFTVWCKRESGGGKGCLRVMSFFFWVFKRF